MVQVEVNVNPSETFDRALARFKKMCGKAGSLLRLKSGVSMRNRAKNAAESR